MERLKEVLEEIRGIQTEVDELLELDELNEDQEERYDELSTRFDELNETRERLIGIEKKKQDMRSALEDSRNAILIPGDSTQPAVYATTGDRVDGDPVGNAEGLKRNQKLFNLDEIRRLRNNGDGIELRKRALAAVDETPDIPGMFTDEQRTHIAHLLRDISEEDSDEMSRLASHIVTVASPEYMRNWRKVVNSFGQTGEADVEALGFIQRAMSLTDASGGYAVPLPIDPTLIKNYDNDVNPFRAISRVVNVTTDVLRTVNSTAVSASWDGEAAEVSDDASTFANIDITVHKAQAFVPYSIEIGQDFPNFSQVMGDLLADARDNLEASAFATGTGTNQPVGIVTALTGGSYEVASNTTDVFAVGDVYDLDEELPSQYSTRATWVANKRIYQAIREAGDAALDDFWVGLRDSVPGTLLGHGLVESSAMDGTVNAAAENYVLILGDFMNYWIADRAGFSVELVPHLFATAANRPSGQRGLYAWWRVGADSVNDRAFRMLNVT